MNNEDTFIILRTSRRGRRKSSYVRAANRSNLTLAAWCFRELDRVTVREIGFAAENLPPTAPAEPLNLASAAGTVAEAELVASHHQPSAGNGPETTDFATKEASNRPELDPADPDQGGGGLDHARGA